MRASARELLVPFLTPLVWRDRGANPRSTAPKADALTTRLSGPVEICYLLCCSKSSTELMLTVSKGGVKQSFFIFIFTGDMPD